MWVNQVVHCQELQEPVTIVKFFRCADGTEALPPGAKAIQYTVKVDARAGDFTYSADGSTLISIAKEHRNIRHFCVEMAALQTQESRGVKFADVDAAQVQFELRRRRAKIKLALAVFIDDVSLS